MFVSLSIYICYYISKSRFCESVHWPTYCKLREMTTEDVRQHWHQIFEMMGWRPFIIISYGCVWLKKEPPKQQGLISFTEKENELFMCQNSRVAAWAVGWLRSRCESGAVLRTAHISHLLPHQSRASVERWTLSSWFWVKVTKIWTKLSLLCLNSHEPTEIAH